MEAATTVQTDKIGYSRNRWHALSHVPQWVSQLVREVQAAGVFTTGIASDKRQRGSAVNWELYGYDEVQGLAVIQVRECVFHPNHFNEVRKDYYLIGRTEDGAPFAHPIDSPLRSRRAMTTPEACARFVLARLWGCDEEDLPHITRQGDVALVPARLPQGAHLTELAEVTVAGSHRVKADRIWTHASGYYVARASMTHLPGQHSRAVCKGGVRRLVVAPRVKSWGFSAPTAD